MVLQGLRLNKHAGQDTTGGNTDQSDSTDWKIKERVLPQLYIIFEAEERDRLNEMQD